MFIKFIDQARSVVGHSHHHHVDPDSGDTRVALAVIVNLGLTIAQVIGGIFAGSLALIADALHNFSDAISLVIAFAARASTSIKSTRLRDANSITDLE